MKKQSNNTFAPISMEREAILTNVVNETLAIEFAQPKVFSEADLWNIQRQRRSIPVRRHFA